MDWPTGVEVAVAEAKNPGDLPHAASLNELALEPFQRARHAAEERRSSHLLCYGLRLRHQPS